MDISVRTVGTWTAEDRSWLGSAHGTDATRTVTLNTSTFTAGTHFPNGFVPSGTALGRITATGLYGPYDDALSNGQNVLAGYLFNSVRMSTGGANVGAPLLTQGAVIEAKLPLAGASTGTAGKVDANGKADNIRIEYR